MTMEGHNKVTASHLKRDAYLYVRQSTQQQVTTNRESAARLFISEATVKTHLLHIYAKLGVTDRAAAVAEAFNRGLLTPGKP